MKRKEGDGDVCVEDNGGGERQRFCTKSESNMRHANDNKEKEPPWVARYSEWVMKRGGKKEKGKKRVVRKK